MNTALSIACSGLAAVSAVLWLRQRRARREAYIRDFVLPHGLFDKLRAQHPHLSLKDCQLVAQGLRQFFLAHLKSGRQYVSMPSQVADDLWHEFILYTRNYDCSGFQRKGDNGDGAVPYCAADLSSSGSGSGCGGGSDFSSCGGDGGSDGGSDGSGDSGGSSCGGGGCGGGD